VAKKVCLHKRYAISKICKQQEAQGYMKNKRVVVSVIAGLLVGLGVAALLIISIPKDSDGKDNSVDVPATQTNGTTNSRQLVTDAKESTRVQSTKVEIVNYAYAPVTVTVKVGQTVTWTNQDSMRHDVVMDDEGAEGPNSELLAKSESYSYTFTKAGTYAYHCSPHPYMKATVVVEE